MSSLIKLFLIVSSCAPFVISDSWGYVKVDGKDVYNTFDCFPLIKCPPGLDEGHLEKFLNGNDITKMESDQKDEEQSTFGKVSTSTFVVCAFTLFTFLILILRLWCLCNRFLSENIKAKNLRNSKQGVITRSRSSLNDPNPFVKCDNTEYVASDPPEYAAVYKNLDEDHPPSYIEVML